jgi:hypothetical protein
VQTPSGATGFAQLPEMTPSSGVSPYPARDGLIFCLHGKKSKKVGVGVRFVRNSVDEKASDATECIFPFS